VEEKELGSLTAREMFARRDAMEVEISELLGRFVFKYSRLVTNLQLCVAWHDAGKGLDEYRALADDLGAAALLGRIRKQSKTKFDAASTEFNRYREWLHRAHEVRRLRNLLMHSRLEIEAYGRHAIATSPIFVEPTTEKHISVDELRLACSSCESLIDDLSKLRREHPL